MTNTSTGDDFAPALKTAESYADPTERFRALAEVYKTDSDPNTRQQARTAMENFSRNPDTTKAAINICVNDTDPDNRQLALRPLDILPGSKDVVQFLTDLRDSDPDPRIREFASHKIAQLAAKTRGTRVPSHYFGTPAAPIVGQGHGYDRAAMLNLLPYLAAPRDEAFLRGKRRHITPESVPLGWLIAAVVGAFFVYRVFVIQYGAFPILSGQTNIVPGPFAFAAWLVGLIEIVYVAYVLNFYRLYLKKRRQYARLSDRGQLLAGRVVDIDSKSQVWLRGRGGSIIWLYTLDLSYNFQTPEGKTLAGSRKTSSFKERIPPEKGAFAAVLYLDENNYEVL